MYQWNQAWLFPRQRTSNWVVSLERKTELTVSSQAIKYKVWKHVKSHITQHQFMARMGQCVCMMWRNKSSFCHRTTLCHKLQIDCEGKLAAVQQQVIGLHEMNVLSVKLDMLMKHQCTSICHQTYCQRCYGIIFGDKTAILYTII
jgi:hypothetical protein